MPIIKPISDLRNKANQISALAQESAEPIFITKDGQGALVVLSIAEYRRLNAKADLFKKLAIAQSQRAAGEKGKPLRTVVRDLKARMRAA
jgi:prevent-host-death family protein